LNCSGWFDVSRNCEWVKRLDYGFLFSVAVVWRVERGVEVESLAEVQRGIARGKTLGFGPQVQCVTVASAFEAVKDLFICVR